MSLKKIRNVIVHKIYSMKWEGPMNLFGSGKVTAQYLKPPFRIAFRGCKFYKVKLWTLKIVSEYTMDEFLKQLHFASHSWEHCWQNEIFYKILIHKFSETSSWELRNFLINVHFINLCYENLLLFHVLLTFHTWKLNNSAKFWVGRFWNGEQYSIVNIYYSW